RRVNALGADLVAVTGDLIVSGEAYVAPVGRALAGLRGRDGVFAVLGNHDYFGPSPALIRALAEGGVRVLRNESVHLPRGGAERYRLGESVLYVNAGVGTTGPPVRLGARAEITLLALERPGMPPITPQGALPLRRTRG